MCGIAGFLSASTIRERDRIFVSAMLRALDHRGPDGTALYADEKICFGSNRLAMVDIGRSHSLRFSDHCTLAYNGEIYNNRMLRSTLEARGVSFQTQCDDETLLHALLDRNSDLLAKVSGMFAFALWDAAEKRLVLGRDIAGVKPLYYLRRPEGLYFGSEIRALHAVLDLDVNQAAIQRYLHLRFVPAPSSAWTNVAKVTPGSLISVDSGEGDCRVSIQTETFQPISKGDDFSTVFFESVKCAAIADTPLGIFLSGGIDSAAVLAAAVHAGESPAVAFSVGYEGSNTDVNEYKVAAEIAAHFSIPHYAEIISAERVNALLDVVVQHLDEPIYSTVSVPTYALSQLASQYVKGVLTGDGADEMFRSYHYLKRVREVAVLGGDWCSEYHEQIGFIPSEWRTILLEDPNPPQVMAKQDDIELWIANFERTYRLPDYHLARIDRLSMACGIEARVPYVAKSLFDWFRAQGAPEIEQDPKHLLRRTVKRFLPLEISTQPKRPFTSPHRSWILGPLRDRILATLSDKHLQANCGVRTTGVQQLLTQMPNGRPAILDTIWGLFMLFEWTAAHNDASVRRSWGA